MSEKQTISGVPGLAGAAESEGLHVGIIMDGNGRWAAARGLPRFEGHRRGVEALRRAVRAASDLGVRYLTVYSFSSENWARPPQEVAELMGLLKLFIRNDLMTLQESGVRVRVIGERDNLKPDIVALLDEAEQRTRRNAKLDLIVAFNYGSRREIVEAARSLARDVASGAAAARGYRRGGLRRAPSYRRDAGSRPHHPHFGRNAPLEFPDVAIRL